MSAEAAEVAEAAGGFEAFVIARRGNERGIGYNEVAECPLRLPAAQSHATRLFGHMKLYLLVEDAEADLANYPDEFRGLFGVHRVVVVPDKFITFGAGIPDGAFAEWLTHDLPNPGKEASDAQR